MSVIALPIFQDDISNKRHYNFGEPPTGTYLVCHSNEIQQLVTNTGESNFGVCLYQVFFVVSEAP